MAKVIGYAVVVLFLALIVSACYEAFTGPKRPDKWRVDKAVLEKADDVDDAIRKDPHVAARFIEELAGTRPEHRKYDKPAPSATAPGRR